MASASEVWSIPSAPRSGLGAGEVVMVLRRVFSSSSASPAVRGGEGRRRWLGASRFWWWCCRWASSPLALLRPAVVARGARSGGGAGFVVVDLGGAASAGRRVVAGSGCCGRVRSATLGSVLLRRTAPAAIYELWRRLLPGGKRGLNFLAIIGLILCTASFGINLVIREAI